MTACCSRETGFEGMLCILFASVKVLPMWLCGQGLNFWHRHTSRCRRQVAVLAKTETQQKVRSVHKTYLQCIKEQGYCAVCQWQHAACPAIISWLTVALFLLPRFFSGSIAAYVSALCSSSASCCLGQCTQLRYNVASTAAGCQALSRPCTAAEQAKCLQR